MATSEEIRKRLELLRSAMKEMQVDLYLMTSSDYHSSEYVDDFFKVSEYFSGCTSDNVKLLIEAESARLWTDGRYFISAQRELQDTGITLMRMGEEYVPTVREYLADHLSKDMLLAFDGRCVSATDGREYRKIAAKNGAKIDSSVDFAERLWVERPAMPSNPITLLSDDYTGESYVSKARRVREALKRRGASYLVLSKLDDIMWLFNLRGGDVAYNPVALSYAILGMDTADLFLEEREVSDVLRDYCRAKRIKLHSYQEFFYYIRDYHFEGAVFVDEEASSDALLDVLHDRASLIGGINPTTMMKAIKNETELERSRHFYLQDSVQVCRFIFWLKNAIKTEQITEISAAKKMDELRSEIEGFLDLSFETISAYNENAAMAHYAPDEASCSILQRKGFLLVDSGGQFEGGTTDVTRTIVLGEVSDEMKRDFTLVAMANLRLLYAKFPYGCTGINLDTYARAPLWEAGVDYNHGTGHGIGYRLNVHEGPQAIRWRRRADGMDCMFEAGMITSDEPGIYRENQWGIRTESITICQEGETNSFGHFLQFEPLTFVPIDLEAIDASMMERSDIRRLNAYHAAVYEKIAPFLNEEEKLWLKDATRRIEE